MSDLDQSPAQAFDLISRGPTEGFVKDYTGGTGGVTPPGGSNNEIQFNNFGIFGGLTDAQLTARIALFTNLLSGAVPISSGGTTNFLRADGAWSVPPGTGGSGGVTDGNKGDITVAFTGTVWTVNTAAITYAKMQHVSTNNRFLGRVSAGTGDVEEVTGAQATSFLDIFTATLKGLATPSGGGTTNFLRADGQWVAPPTGAAGARTQRSITSGPVTLVSGDSILNINVASSLNIFLPVASTRAGSPLTFKDVGAHAAANNITIVPNGAEKIDGANNFVMTNDRQAITVNPFNDGVNTGWFIT